MAREFTELETVGSNWLTPTDGCVSQCKCASPIINLYVGMSILMLRVQHPHRRTPAMNWNVRSTSVRRSWPSHSSCKSYIPAIPAPIFHTIFHSHNHNEVLAVQSYDTLNVYLPRSRPSSESLLPMVVENRMGT